MTSIDRYTKFILTIIALALVVIASRLLVVSAPAGAADLGQGCGSDSRHPCYVAGWGPAGTIPVANSHDLPLKVLVTNPPAHAVPVIASNSAIPLAQPRR
jgi:hypothetical protein